MTARDERLRQAMIREVGKFSDVTRLETERWLSKRQSSNEPDAWYHGGCPGLSMGQMVLPASATGFAPLQQMLTDMGITSSIYVDMIDPSYDPDFVYITHNRALARDHAAAWCAWNYIKTGQWEQGRMYRVSPASLIVPAYSPGRRGVNICCCMTHGPDTPCSAKVKSAMVDTAEEMVSPVLSGVWLKLYDNLRPVCDLWRKKVYRNDYHHHV